jgi:hypothetical protein
MHAPSLFVKESKLNKGFLVHSLVPVFHQPHAQAISKILNVRKQRELALSLFLYLCRKPYICVAFALGRNVNYVSTFDDKRVFLFRFGYANAPLYDTDSCGLADTCLVGG